MNNEVENKVFSENEKGAAQEAKQTINFVDVFKSEVTRDAKTGSANDFTDKQSISNSTAKDNGSSISEHLGKLSIHNDKLEGLKSGTLDNFSEKMRKYEPLSKLENMILDNVSDAIRNGQLEKIQDALGALNENPKMVDRVLQALKERMESEDPRNSVNWEQGHDNNGRNFVRLNLYHRNDDSKSSGGTELTVGSDGRTSATYTDRWDSLPQTIKPQEAAQAFREQRWIDPGWKNPDGKFPSGKYPEDMYPIPHRDYSGYSLKKN